MTDISKPQDESVDTELARANLARLRGDYDAAETLCQGLLKRAPHDATVAALLGDIAAEQGNLPGAAQWYGLAVDSGAPTGIAEKLDAIKERLKRQEAMATEVGIGLPARTLINPSVLLAMVVVGLMLLFGAYIAGTTRAPAPVSAPVDHAPIAVPPSSYGTSSAISAPTASAEKSPATAAGSVTASTIQAGQTTPAEIDPALAPFLVDTTEPLSRITRAEMDPRSRAVTIEAAAQTGEDPRALAASIAYAAMSRLKDAALITIRISDSGKPIYIGDATRDKFDGLPATPAQSAGAQGQPGLADELLTNEWRVTADAAGTGR